jgi:hypothetical protein
MYGSISVGGIIVALVSSFPQLEQKLCMCKTVMTMHVDKQDVVLHLNNNSVYAKNDVTIILREYPCAVVTPDRSMVRININP